MTEPIQRGEFLEPWAVWQMHGICVIQSEGAPNTPSHCQGTVLFEMDEDAMFKFAEVEMKLRGMDEDEIEDNAEDAITDFGERYANRIAVCINACRGISNEDLARGVVPVGEAAAVAGESVEV